MEYEYSSGYTKRPLIGSIYNARPRSKEQRVTVADRLLGNTSLQPAEDGIARQRQKYVAQEQEKRKQNRLKYGFHLETESTVKPFRAFSALDNTLMDESRMGNQSDVSIERLRRQLESEKQRNTLVSKSKGKCNYSKALNLNKLKNKYEQVQEQREIDRINKLIDSKFRLVRPAGFLENGLNNRVSFEAKNNKTDLLPLNSLSEAQATAPEMAKVAVETASFMEIEPPMNENEPVINPSKEQLDFVSFAKSGELREMKALYRKCSDKFEIDSIAPKLGQNALHAASTNARIEIIEYLLKMGANTKIKDLKGNSVLDTLNNGFAKNSRHPNHYQLGRCCAYMKSTTIWEAAKEGDHSRVKWLIDSGLAKVDARNRYQMTPMHFAYLGQNLRMIRTLLELGANPIVYNSLRQLPEDMCDLDFYEQVLKDHTIQALLK